MSAVPSIAWGAPEERVTYWVADAGGVCAWRVTAAWRVRSSSLATIHCTIARHDGVELTVEQLANAVGHKVDAVAKLLRVWSLIAFRDAERGVTFAAEFPVRRVWSESVTWEVMSC